MRPVAWVLAGFLAAAVSLAGMKTYYALELRGGSKVYAVDKPLQKGRVVLFHRYPDGVYLSLAASEVEKVSAIQSEDAPAPADRLAPGATLYVGPVLHGPAYEAPPAPEPPAVGYVDYGYVGYGDYFYDGGYVPPLPPAPRVPSRIGPNGFPIIAPPGAPGSVPPPIGPNGYPIISPPPVQVQPVTRRR
jgi:hypothetical protein